MRARLGIPTVLMVRCERLRASNHEGVPRLFRCAAFFQHGVGAVGVAGGGFGAEIGEGDDAVVAEVEADDEEAAFLEPGEQAPGAAGWRVAA